MSCHSLLTWRVSAEKLADSLLVVPLYVPRFLLLLLKSSCVFTFNSLIIICLGMGPFEVCLELSRLPGSECVFVPRLGKFSALFLPSRAVLICPVVSNSLRPRGLWPTRLLCPWDSPGKNTGVGCHALLQGIFPAQGLNPGLPHCRQILYRLSHQGSPRLP